MKPKILVLLWILGIIPTFSYSQGNFPKKDSQKIETENNDINLYNLYYVSKYLGSAIDDQNIEKQLYATLISQIPKNKLQSTSDPNIIRLIAKYNVSLEVYKQTISDFLIRGKFEEVKSLKKEFDLKKLDLEMLENKYGILNTCRNQLDSKSEEKINVINKLIKLIENFQNPTISENYSSKSLITTLSHQDMYDEFNIRLTGAEETTKADSTEIHDKLSLDDLNYKRTNLQNEIKKVNDCQIEYQKIIDTEIEKLKIKDFEVRISNPGVQYITVDEPAVDQQITINSIVQNSQKDLSYSGLSLPSESQMIEAMAIFLAKRAKQEAAIWFMDEIRNRMNNPLVYDAFPETIKLIDHLQDYQTPNFSSSWRYAISSDLVKMPKNIVSSEWVKNVIIKDLL